MCAPRPSRCVTAGRNIVTHLIVLRHGTGGVDRLECLLCDLQMVPTTAEASLPLISDQPLQRQSGSLTFQPITCQIQVPCNELGQFDH